MVCFAIVNLGMQCVLIALLDRNGSFKFAASALTPKMFIWMHDHKTLGKDKEIGEAEIDVRVCFVEIIRTIPYTFVM